MTDATQPHALLGLSYARVEELERFLGDPRDPSNIVCFESAMALDEQEAFPQAGFDHLTEWGAQLDYIPAELGGRQTSVEHMLAVARAISRRDLTLAIAHGKTYLGLLPIWAAGTDAQRLRIAKLASMGTPIAFGLTERAHGSDLLASDTAVNTRGDKLFLTGEKWLINNGTRSGVMVVLARSDEKRGPRALSLVLVEKDRLCEQPFQHLPKIRTLGIRGADISGIRFEAVELPSDACLGAPGTGLETTLRIIQVTRVLCAGFSLGAGDTALRCCVDFALARQLYGASVFEIPSVRRTLIDALSDLLLADATAIVSARLAHAAPAQLSVASAIAKYFIPTTVETVISDVGVVLGARHYLREGHWCGVFQKLARDAAVVSFFDGSTAVNLHSLGLQLRQLTAAAQEAPPSSLQNAVFHLSTTLPPLALDRLALSARGQDVALQSLNSFHQSLRLLLEDETVSRSVLSALLAQVAQLRDEASSFGAALDAIEAEAGMQGAKSPAIFGLAKRYAHAFAAAAAVGLWLYNRTELSEELRGGEWLVVALSRIVPNAHVPSAEQLTVTASLLISLFQQDRLYSIVPFKLARRA